MGVEVLLFLGIGALALTFAVLMLSTENAVHSALCLIANFGCVAFLFLMLNAPFLAMVQVAVYAGAIMVLFLFVIMLLKAEQTSDTTTRTFPRLWILVIILAVGLFVPLALPLVGNQIALPKQATPDPSVRILNASTLSAVDLTVNSTTLPAPITISGLAIDTATEFETLPAGTYIIGVRDPETGSPVGGGRVTLNQGDVVTLVASGEYNAEKSTTISVLPVTSNGAEAGNDNARLVLYNSIPEALDVDNNPIKAPVSLVDLGPEGAVTKKLIDGNDVLIDRIIIPTVAKDGTGVVTYPRGTYNLALLDQSFNVIAHLDNYVVKPDTETLVLYVPEGGSSKGVIHTITNYTAPAFGSPKGIGRMLFTDYLLPVNLVGMLLLVALVGVITLSRQDVEKQERRVNVRRKVSRPLVNVISTQTGSDVVAEAPQLPTGDS